MTATVEPITAEITLDGFETIRKALFNSELSRTFDKRTFAEGNLREGVVSVLHGRPQRNRRRIENSQFRASDLHLYERELFPPIVERFIAEESASGEADLFHLGEHLAVVLAAKRAGFDVDMDDRPALEHLVHFVDAFSQLSAILDAKDPDAVRSRVLEALQGFMDDFGMPSLQRRAQLLKQFAAGEIPEAELPHDILTNLVRHRDDPAMELTDDLRIVREAATYLQGGTHTSSVTLINALEYLFDTRDARPDDWDRVKTDRAFAQRVIHETLRLSPTTPRARRRAEHDTEIDGLRIPEGAMVILDLVTANRDPDLFGPDAEAFNPDRKLDPKVPRWGHSFGAGPHICPGRNVAGGLPQLVVGADLDPDHLYGLVPIMLQAVVARSPERHPDKPQERDTQTERYTRWSSYWVRFLDPDGISAER